jgi:hypothetical protein
MNAILLTIHPAVGEGHAARVTPGRYPVGCSGEAEIRLPYEGVAEWQLVLWIQEDRVQVEPLAVYP